MQILTQQNKKLETEFHSLKVSVTEILGKLHKVDLRMENSQLVYSRGREGHGTLNILTR